MRFFPYWEATRPSILLIIEMAEKSRRPIANKRTQLWAVPLRNAKLGHAQFLQIVYGFALDETATETARQSGVSLRTVNNLYEMLRGRLLHVVPTALPPAYEREPDIYRQVVEWAHESRRRAHRGWRKELEAHRLAETRARVTVRDYGSFWLMAALLGSAYNEKLERY